MLFTKRHALASLVERSKAAGGFEMSAAPPKAKAPAPPAPAGVVASALVLALRLAAPSGGAAAAAPPSPRKANIGFEAPAMLPKGGGVLPSAAPIPIAGAEAFPLLPPTGWRLWLLMLTLLIAARCCC